jgi:hypothetical protein
MPTSTYPAVKSLSQGIGDRQLRIEDARRRERRHRDVQASTTLHLRRANNGFIAARAELEEAKAASKSEASALN